MYKITIEYRDEKPEKIVELHDVSYDTAYQKVNELNTSDVKRIEIKEIL